MSSSAPTIVAKIAAYLDETRFRPIAPGRDPRVTAIALIAEVRRVFPTATAEDIDAAWKAWGLVTSQRCAEGRAAMEALEAGDASLVTPEMRADIARLEAGGHG